MLKYSWKLWFYLCKIFQLFIVLLLLLEVFWLKLKIKQFKSIKKSLMPSIWDCFKWQVMTTWKINYKIGFIFTCIWLWYTNSETDWNKELFKQAGRLDDFDLISNSYTICHLTQQHENECQWKINLTFKSSKIKLI